MIKGVICNLAYSNFKEIKRMELKDKLDLLWKYLLLLIIVVGMCSHLCHRGCGKYRCDEWKKDGIDCKYKKVYHDQGYHEEIEDVQIKMEVDGEDTLLSVIVNGEELPDTEAKAFMKKKEEKGLRKMLKREKIK